MTFPREGKFTSSHFFASKDVMGKIATEPQLSGIAVDFAGGCDGFHLGTLALKTEDFSKKIGRFSKTQKWIY